MPKYLVLILFILCNLSILQPQNTTTFHNGNTSTQVNPDGTHTTTFHNGNTSNQVNPNGTMSTNTHSGSNSNQVTQNDKKTTKRSKKDKDKDKDKDKEENNKIENSSIIVALGTALVAILYTTLNK